MFGWIGKIFGSDKVIDGAMSGIDALVFTDQEKAEMKEVFRFLTKQYHHSVVDQRSDLNEQQKQDLEEIFKIIIEKYHENDVDYLKAHARSHF